MSYKDLYDKSQARNYSVVDEEKEMGRSRILILCPFCKTNVWAFVWSLAGKGKICPGCKAKHEWLAGTSPRMKEGNRL